AIRQEFRNTLFLHAFVGRSARAARQYGSRSGLFWPPRTETDCGWRRRADLELQGCAFWSISQVGIRWFAIAGAIGRACHSSHGLRTNCRPPLALLARFS